MKIKRRMVERSTLERFAETHNFTLVISERHDPGLPRYFAAFDRVDIKEGSILRGAYGDGNTEQEAMDDYRAHISARLLVFSAHTDDRFEVWAPVLVPLEAEDA